METPAVETGVVVKLDRGFPLVRLGDGRELRCEHATSLVKGSDQRAVVGDVVRISLPDGHDKGIIEETLPRRTSFVRKDPTERALPQTLAANFDLVIIAQPIEDTNTRRLERELVLAHETGAEVLVVLTKAAAGEATEYAQEHCMKYFEFQYTWGDIMARMESDGGLRQALVQAAIARQSGGEVVVEAAAPAGSIPGAVIGANLIRRVPERQLRIAFGVFLLISAVVLLGNEVAAL